MRALLEDQCPQWADQSVQVVGGSGTDNVMWRLGSTQEDQAVVRLPRTVSAARGIANEHRVLTQLARSALLELVEVPTILHAGSPSAGFPHPWTVMSWIEGDDAWTLRDETAKREPELAESLAQVVSAIGDLRLASLPDRRAGDRGGPLPNLLDRLDRWLDDPAWRAADLVDVGAIRRVAVQARDVVGEPVDRRVAHGDLIPGNVLIRDGRLAAVIDWSGAAMADPAQDLAPAWSILGPVGRATFREALGVDDATWLRGRAFELEHAVGAVLYYRPRNHPLADVMERTLRRILSEG